MCRHIAYWGPPVPLAGPTLESSNALILQCTTAREMAWGQDNLDGWGFAWQQGTDPVQSYRSARPLTADPDGRAELAGITADRFLVHVRQKTPGSATNPANSAPFDDGHGRFFTHNGYVADFREGVREQLLTKVSPERAAGIRGDTDSELLFALVLSRIDDGAAPAEAVRAVADVGELYGGRYNVLLWADDTIVATRWDNSLYLRTGDATAISSEPLDDGQWTPVPDRSMVIVNGAGARQEEL